MWAKYQHTFLFPNKKPCDQNTRIHTIPRGDYETKHKMSYKRDRKAIKIMKEMATLSRINNNSKFVHMHY